MRLLFNDYLIILISSVHMHIVREHLYAMARLNAVCSAPIYILEYFGFLDLFFGIKWIRYFGIFWIRYFESDILEYFGLDYGIFWINGIKWIYILEYFGLDYGIFWIMESNGFIFWNILD